MTAPVSLSQAQARRIALAAQGFLDPPHSPPTMRTLARTVARTGVLQVDSVNVLERAHYMPLYSRMGPYDKELLHRANHGSTKRRLVEYWAHVQAFMPVELWPVMRHRMADHRASRADWLRGLPDDLPDRLLELLVEEGPATARDLDFGEERTKEHWGWNWSQARRGLDYLYSVGDIAMAGRNSQFEVRYDLTERVIPAEVLRQPTPSLAEAARELVRLAARSHGVATAPCLADYYRMRLQPKDPAELAALAAIEELVEAGELIPATIEGWSRPAYLHRDARRPRAIRARTLLSPFDPVVWHRERTEHLFDFHYRIEIYTPAAKRVYGYYVLPFLLGDQIVARVDLKADRSGGVLLVPGAFAEAQAPPETAAELARELWRLAGWLGLDDIRVGGHGDLAARLAEAVTQPHRG